MRDYNAERIKWCQEVRYAAAAQLRLIEKGYRLFSAEDDAPMHDVRTELAEHERAIIKKMDDLIAGYEARIA